MIYEWLQRVYNDLKIVEYNRSNASVRGQDRIFLFTSKISKEDIEVRFKLEDENVVKVEPKIVHRNCGLIFDSPNVENHILSFREYIGVSKMQKIAK